jgi:hypothetical protein
LPVGHPFTNVQAGYWSSTTYANGRDYAWVVGMWDGGVGYDVKSDYHVYVWPVRAGQIQSPGCSSWDQVISKYQEYVSGTASWADVIECYQGYAS